MSHFSKSFRLIATILFVFILASPAALAAITDAGSSASATFPRALSSYNDDAITGFPATLLHRIHADPFNLIATVIFLLAVIHTFLTTKFRHWAHVAEEKHAARLARRAERDQTTVNTDENGVPIEVSFKGQVLHFLGEVEAVFGIWVIPLIAAIIAFRGWHTVIDYVGHGVNFTEPLFVVVVMAIAGTRPVLRCAEICLRAVARLGGGSAAAWWLSILIIAPLLGSLITEPAAMTIAALLLARQFYTLKPSPRLAYATVGLLFVNISVGGTLTHFAAPPVLMVAATWKWDTAFMFTHFGWKAAVGIAAASLIYYLIFRREFSQIEQRRRADANAAANASGVSTNTPTPSTDDAPGPPWITIIQLAFLAFTVFVAHYPPLFIGGFLFFLAFAQATAHHQGRLDIKPPMLVGFFLAGLVIHGGLQGWWIEPVLKNLGEIPLYFTALALSPFNDNAAITYLATLVPDFTDSLKYIVVAGAVTGGGLTVIANAPNPAGQNILQRFFTDGISPLGLLLGALLPTAIMAAAFLLL